MVKKTRAIAAAAAVAALMLTGCSTSSGGDGGESGDGGGDAITFTSWGGAYQDAQLETYGKSFTDGTGITVRSDGPTDYAKIKAQVESDNVDWDVVTVEPFWAVAQCGKLIQKIDIDRSELVEGAGSDCGVPVSATAYPMAYNADVYKDEAPTGWADFFDTEKFPGKRAVWNYAPGIGLEVALLADGVPADQLYPLDIDRALKKLDTIRDDIAFFDTGAQLTQMLESGEATMAIAWNGRGYDAAVNGANIKPIWDNSMILFDVMVIPDGSKNVDNAKKFIENAITTESQNEFVNMFPSGSSNVNVTAPSDELKNAWSPDGAGKGKSILVDNQWWADNYDAATEAWTAWAAG